MLDQMRNNARNWLIYLIFGAIIVVFSINFGPGFDQMSQTGCQTRGGVAATVNGKDIPTQLFKMQWRSRSQQIPARFLRAFKIKERTMDLLVDTELLGQQADQIRHQSHRQRSVRQNSRRSLASKKTECSMRSYSAASLTTT